MKNYKYKISFSSRIKAVIPTGRDKFLAKASLDSLKGILPDDINVDDNPDLLYIAGNAFVAGMSNLNSDGVSKATAIQIAPKFKYKFIDKNHERADIIGCIFNFGYSKYGSNELLTEEQAENSEEPFNVAIGGFIWKVPNPELADLIIDASDENSSNYGSVSLSWEVFLDDYDIVIGNKEISKAELVPTAQFEVYDKLLRANGGDGLSPDGRQLYRIIKGDALPVGIGVVSSPAANVRGLYVLKSNSEQENLEVNDSDSNIITNTEINETEEEKEIEKLGEIAASKLKFKDTKLKTSQNQENKKNNNKNKNKCVKNNSIMKITKIADINDENSENFSLADVRHFLSQQISEEIDKASSTYAEQLEAKQAELKNHAADAAKVQAQLEDTQKQIEDLKSQLEQEKQSRAAEKAQADFNSRMTNLDNEYELGDKEREVIAKRIKDLDDTSFSNWLEEFSLFAAKKKKAAKPDPDEDGDDDSQDDGKNKKDKDMDASQSKASLEDALETAEEKKSKNLVNTPSVEKTVKEQFAEAFSLDAFNINYK